MTSANLLEGIYVTRYTLNVWNQSDTYPYIVYGGLTILGVISNGPFGTPGPKNLTSSQIAYRAGHAHAGVLTLLALFLQIALDYVALPNWLV